MKRQIYTNSILVVTYTKLTMMDFQLVSVLLLGSILVYTG